MIKPRPDRLPALVAAIIAVVALTACRGPAPGPTDRGSDSRNDDKGPPGADQPEPASPEKPPEKTGIPASGAIQSTEIVYSANRHNLLAHMVRHENPGTAPILVLLNDEFGIDDFLRARAERYARLGYNVVCPDMADIGTDPADDVVVANVRAAMNAAEASLDRTPPVNRFAIIGWSVGGTYALTAARYLDFETIIVCYGQLVTNPELLLGLREPVLGIFGMKDPMVTRAQIDEFKDIFTKMGGTFEGNIWKDEGHGFMRTPADPQNVKEADVEIIRWLDTYFSP